MRLTISRVLWAVLFMIVTASLGSVHAAVQGPGWFNVTREPVDPGRAQGYYKAQAQGRADQTRTQFQTATAQAAAAAAAVTTSSNEITELARSLRNDPALIYEYVRNHVHYVPYFGYLKGPELTLLERSGNDFDQAVLLVELLRAAGHTAQFVYGQMTIPSYGAASNKDMRHWLGIDANTLVLAQILGSGGIPATVSSSTVMNRVWVQATVNGGTYLLDPAFKVYQEVAGVDLTSAIGYSQANLLAAAGGQTGTDYVQNLSSTGVRASLDAYTATLVSYLRANHANADIREIIGGRTIVEESTGVLPSSLPFAASVAEYWDVIPDVYVHKLRIQHGGIDQTLNMPEIAARKVAITYANSGGAAAPAAAQAQAVTEDAGASSTLEPQPQPTGAVLTAPEPTTVNESYEIPVQDPLATSTTATAQSAAVPEPQAVQATMDFGRITPLSSSSCSSCWGLSTHTRSPSPSQ